MDAALLVEEESTGVGAVDHTNYTQSSSSLDLSDLRQKENCEKHRHESQEDGEVIEMDENDYQISHEEHEEKKPEGEGVSPQETDTKEEDMASKHENCGQELKECEDMAEEESNTTQEEEEEKVPQVTSDLNLQQEPDGDLKEGTTEPEHTELSQQDKKLDENVIDNKKNEEKEVDEKNLKEMEHQMVKEPSDMKEEMEHESSEQYQEPKGTEVKEENKQDGLVETVMPEVEDVKSDSSAGIAMDVSYGEEKMQVADPEDAERFVNVGKCSD